MLSLLFLMIYGGVCWTLQRGYRKYELVTAMQFKSVYSMRMYELMSGQKRPLEFTF